MLFHHIDFSRSIVVQAQGEMKKADVFAGQDLQQQFFSDGMKREPEVNECQVYGDII